MFLSPIILLCLTRIISPLKIPLNPLRQPPISQPYLKSAIGPAIPPEKGYVVEEIRGGLYWVTDGSYNTMFMVTDEGVVVIDAPPSIGANYLKAIAEVTDKPINYVIYSHSHLDHIGARCKHISRKCYLHSS